MDFQIEILQWIQSFQNPALDLIARCITFFGEQYFVVPIAAFCFWCVDKELGYWLCWCTGLTNLLTNGIKGIFKTPRPIGTPGIRSIATENATGYSFPSAHSTNSAALFMGFARALNRRRFWILAAVMPPLVALSRLYLGCHWPTDVIAGTLIGIAMPLLLWLFYRKWAKKKTLLFFLSTALFLPFCFVLKEDSLDFWKIFGFQIGVIIGTFLETKYINFSVPEGKKQKTLRFFGGMVLILLCYLPMKLLFPETIPFTVLRYAVVPVVAIAFWPWLFQKFGF